MTIVLALHDPTSRETWIGSDRRGTKEALFIDAIQKWVFLSDEWAVGVSGDSRAISVLTGERAAGRLEPIRDPYHFTEQLRAIFEAQKWRPNDRDYGAPEYGSSFLLAHPTGIWDIGGALSVTDVTERRFWATGSGRDYALGAYFATRDYGMPASERVAGAIEAACAHDPACGGEPWVRHLRLEPQS